MPTTTGRGPILSNDQEMHAILSSVRRFPWCLCQTSWLKSEILPHRMNQMLKTKHIPLLPHHLAPTRGICQGIPMVVRWVLLSPGPNAHPLQPCITHNIHVGSPTRSEARVTAMARVDLLQDVSFHPPCARGCSHSTIEALPCRMWTHTKSPLVTGDTKGGEGMAPMVALITSGAMGKGTPYS